MRLYLDVCCLNRPFDDQTQDRIRLESEAVMTILSHIEQKHWEWISGEMVDFEIDRMPDPDRRVRVSLMTADATETVCIDENERIRADDLSGMGFKAADALHIACAEKGRVNVLLTTDDRFLKAAKRNATELALQVRNPLEWVKEIMS